MRANQYKEKNHGIEESDQESQEAQGTGTHPTTYHKN
jgi:hypothetical protein